MKFLALLFGSLLLISPLFLIVLRRLNGKKARTALFGHASAFFGIFVLASVFTLSGHAMAADTATATSTVASVAASTSFADGMKYLSAALAVGISGIAAAIAVSSSASAALGALSENENLFGKALIFVAMAEGIALFGLIVAILLIFMG